MSARSVEARLIKLETRRQRPDEMLLVWRRPDSDVRKAVSGAKYEPGDKVICVEWFDDGPLPAPRWHKDRRHSLDASSAKNLDLCLAKIRDRIEGDKPRDPAFVPFPHWPAARTAELTDHQLLYALLGVAT